jgi:DNA-binding response OmpR family regulator
MKAPADVRILVVEDDPFFQRVLQKRLTMEGYQVFLASDGREGMKAIVTTEPDLVISDWMMPQVDGLELCQSVKTGLREAAPYFILLTAKGEISDKLLALETGADDYLVKPCDQGELLARIRAGLRIVELTQVLRRSAAERGGSAAAIGTRAASLCPRCRRVQDFGGTWHDPAEWLRQGGLVTGVSDVCPACQATNRFGGASGVSASGETGEAKAA